MKIIPLLFALSVVALPGVALAETSFVNSAGALAAFEHISDDGCVHTVGEIALVQATGGELASGLYITGSQEDVCTGAGNGFASFTEGNFPVISLLSAQYHHGIVIAPSYSSGADITFDIDLKWQGRGAISFESTNSPEEGVSFSLSRNARTRGHVRADGVDMRITSARLIHQTSVFSQ